MAQLSENRRLKMEKLLAMSKSSNENEAAIATRQLHFLLSKHNLSIIDIDVDKDDIGQNQEDFGNGLWTRGLGAAIAELYFCGFYTTKPTDSKTRFTLTGSQVNRLFAMSLIKNVIATLNSEARSNSRKEYGKIYSAYITSFRNAAVFRVWERCQALKAQAESGTLKSDTGETLPSLIPVYERELAKLDDFYADNDIEVKIEREREIKLTNAKGAVDGEASANKLNLSRGIENNQQAALGHSAAG